MSNPEVKIRLALDGASQVQAGVDATAASLGKLNTAAAQVGKGVQLSGQQMAQVSAQLQDLFIQIQGGQAPLTALLQQGSQLNTVFGGTGEALRAVGGTLLGLLNPLTIAAGALGALAFAYKQGSAETDGYRRALVLTGGAAGVTVGQLQAMARAQSEVAGTQGKAAEALGLLAANGKVAGEQLGFAADAAIRLERLADIPIEQTAKKFAELGKAPLDALVKLNEAENFLTRSVYEQIKALEAQGDVAGAAAAAQSAYADALAGRTRELQENLGYIERGWLAVKDGAKSAWDAMLNVGRPDDPIEKAQKQLDILRDKAKSPYRDADDARQLAQAEKVMSLLLAQRDAKAQEAKAQAESNEKIKEEIKLRGEASKFLSKDKLAAKELADAQVKGEQLIKAGLIERRDLEQTLAALREKNKDKSGDSAAETARRRALDEEAGALARINGEAATYRKQLEAIDRLLAKRQITPQQATTERARLAADQPAAREAAKEVEATRKAWDDTLKAYEAYLAKLNQGGDQVAARVAQLRLEAEAGELAASQNISLAEAIEQVTVARLLDQRSKSANNDEIAALDREIAKRRELGAAIRSQDAAQQAAKAAGEASKRLDEFLDPSKAETFGEALTKAFDGAGNSLAKLSNGLQQYTAQQLRFAQAQADISVEKDPAKKMAAQLKLNQDAQKSQIALYANMAGAAKGFFKEGTQGYKTLEAAETAFRAYQLASDLVKGASAAAVAIANQAQGDPYTAFPRMAAMAAAMAALGFAVSGGFAKGGSTGGDGAKQATGQGTVFGDAQAKSESINKATERLADTARLQLTTQSGMLAALRNIQNTIGGITNLVLRSGQSAGSVADQFGIRTGTTVPGGAITSVIAGGVVGVLDQLLLGGKITQALFGKTTRITGNGLFAGAQDLGSIVGNGLNLQDFADVNTSRKLFGIKVSNKNSTQYSPADAVLQQQFGLVFKNFYDAIKLASTPLDAALSDVTARLDSFVVDIGKIDLKGLTGEQIQEKLAAVLGAAGDSIAAAALPGLEAFQNVGEGYFETVVRVASGVETAGAALELLGINAINFTDIAKKQGDVAAEIVRQSIAGFESLDGSLSSVGGLINTLDGSADDLLEAYRSLVDVRDVLISVGESGDSLTAAMIRGAGGLEKLQSSLSDYLENFFSEAEQTAAGKASLQGQFSRLGLGELPKTREAFRELVEGVNTSTESGQKLYAQLVGLSGAFAELVPATATLADNAAEAAERIAEAGRRALESLGQSRQQLEVELLRAQGNDAGAIARERANALARSTAGLNATDTAAVTAALAYNNALADQITSLRAATEAQKAAEQAAAQAAQQAIAEAQRRADAILSERTSLEDRLLQLQGDTTALRARELAGLDASNRALLERIFALQDAQTAEQAAAEAASAAADATRQAAEAAAQALDALNAKLSDLAGTRFDLENELLGLNGNAGEVARRTRERDLAGLTQGLSATDAARVTSAYDFNLALRQQIEATKAAQEAAKNLADEQARAADEAQRAADQFRSAWQSITDTLFDEVARIRGLLGIGSGSSLASAQAQFAITTAQARAGDQEAAKLLPGLSQTLLGLAEQSAASLIDLQRIRAQVAASLEQTGTGLAGRFGLTVPKFEVGTNYVPRDMLAMLHEGEAVVPRAYNPAAGGEGSVALVQEVRGLREDNKAQALAIVKLQADLGRIVKRWDTDGMPEVRATA